MFCEPNHKEGKVSRAVLQDPFDLEAEKLISARSERFGGALPLLLHQRMHFPAQLRIGHSDKPPRLHEADAGCTMGGIEQGREHGRINRVRMSRRSAMTR